MRTFAAFGVRLLAGLAVAVLAASLPTAALHAQEAEPPPGTGQGDSSEPQIGPLEIDELFREYERLPEGFRFLGPSEDSKRRLERLELNPLRAIPPGPSRRLRGDFWTPDELDRYFGRATFERGH